MHKQTKQKKHEETPKPANTQILFAFFLRLLTLRYSTAATEPATTYFSLLKKTGINTVICFLTVGTASR